MKIKFDSTPHSTLRDNWFYFKCNCISYMTSTEYIRHPIKHHNFVGPIKMKRNDDKIFHCAHTAQLLYVTCCSADVDIFDDFLVCVLCAVLIDFFSRVSGFISISIIYSSVILKWMLSVIIKRKNLF